MTILEKAIARQPRLPRFLCHLYQRLRLNRLNLVTGAGISVEAGVPNWAGLLDQLAADKDALSADLGEHRKSGLNPEYLGQIIYHRFKSSFPGDELEDNHIATVEHGWCEAIHKVIYENVPKNIEDVIKNHSYLNSLCKLTRNVPLVINFNFDDILSDAIGEMIKAGDKTGNAISVTWQAPPTDRSGLTTIYHVNGILPRIGLRKRSPQLIFTEDSFADARARAPGVNAEYLFLRFIQNTMLLIGHSLADSSLKSYLRLNRDKSPANHHYMIFFIKDEHDVSESRRKDIFEANLELYNLITIFLTSSEIHGFIELLNLDEREFRDELDKLGEDRRWRYHYYIVGPVAAGKSTLLEQLRCFQTIEEWTRPPPREMYLASTKLDDSQREIIDNFVFSEIKEKNQLMHEARVGFHFMDRAPLDLYAFSESKTENQKKSESLRKVVMMDRSLQKGEIIFIEASPGTLVRRNLARGRLPEEAGTEDYLVDQIDSLKEIYKPSFVLSTDQCNAGEVARKVVRRVLFGDYAPKDLDMIVGRYENA